MRKKKKRFQLSAPVKYELLGVFLFTLGALSLLALLGFHAGFVGRYLEKILTHLFGVGAYLVPFVVMLIGVRYIWRHAPIVYTWRFFGLHLLFFSLLAMYHHFSAPANKEILPASLTDGGGLFGGMLLLVLRKCFGADGALVVLFAFVLGAVLLSTTWSLASALARAKNSLKQAREAVAAARARRGAAEETQAPEPALPAQDARVEAYDDDSDRRFAQLAASVVVPMRQEAAQENEPPAPALPAPPEAAPAQPAAAASGAPEAAGDYKLPEVAAILQKLTKTKSGKMAKEIAEKARVLETTLESFRVSAKIVNACNGPAVTRYELEPAPGVKVSRIVNLADDLALKLAAPGVRIEAPIPGKAAIGIEVPNTELSGVHLREVLEDGDFFAAKSKLSVGLGIDIGGKAIVADLGKMPHLLVAGATGSGKSVCINTIITSILFKARPDEVKFILIDPKMVELSNYNGIPHLMVPVVIDAKKAASVLNWAVQEMERRYAMFAAGGVRDMERYNKSESGRLAPMAAIVIIIDELADLMMVSPVDVEDAICRLAQKARAAGIHLVLATQRPSVDVITGIIKANVPSRISFAVSSQIDSRTILDVGGAEKLLGKGDMLYYPVGAAKPLRVQGAFISDAEVEALIEFIRKQGEPEENEEILRFTESNGEEAAGPKDTPQDELLEDAIRLVLETGQASASMLQRRFRVGYTRAARLIDTMEQMRIIGPNVGSKARDILMSSEQVAQLYFKKEA